MKPYDSANGAASSGRRVPTAHGLPAPPDEAALRDAALRHLARYAATRAGLLRVLERRITRWQRGAEADAGSGEAAARARLTAVAVVDRLVAAGVVNDTAFAEQRAQGLARAGLSRRAIAARLAAKGVEPDTAREVVRDDADTELAAALVLARRRRIGPFRSSTADAQGRQRELAILARAGYAQPVARQALAMGPEEAEARIRALRQ